MKLNLTKRICWKKSYWVPKGTRGNYQRYVLVLWAALCSLCFVISTVYGATPEYLAAEERAPKSLGAVTSALSDFVEDIEEEMGILRGGSWIISTLKKSYPEAHPFFRDSRMDLNVRSYYFDRDNGNGTSSEAWALGGSLDYESGWIQDHLRVGFSVYTSQKLYGPEGRDGTGLLRDGQDGYTVLGQAYLEAKYNETLVKLFRQKIDLPFLNSNDSRMTPNTFEAYSLSQDFKGLDLILAHVTRIRRRTSSNFVAMSEAAGAESSEKGTTSVGVAYQFNDHTVIGGINHYTWDVMNIFYSQADMKVGLTEELGVELNVQYTHQEDVGEALIGDFSTDSWGVSTSMGYQALIGTVGYTTTNSEAGIRSPFGGHPNFASLMISDFDRAGEDTLFCGLSYNFSELGLDGLSAFARYAYGRTPNSGSAASPDEEEFNITIDYRFQNTWLKPLWIRIRGGWNSQDGGRSRNNYRIILNYTIPLL